MLPLKYRVFCTLYVKLPPVYYGIYWAFPLLAAVSLRRRVTNFALTKYKWVKKLLGYITKKWYKHGENKVSS